MAEIGDKHGALANYSLTSLCPAGGKMRPTDYYSLRAMVWTL